MKIESPIALALSGGGIRAMAFHLGVLKFMAEQNWLEDIARISTVSGGSLVAGLVYAANGFRWPTSLEFLNKVYEQVGNSLCTRSMSWGSLTQLRSPRNWRFLLSRANLLAAELRKHWGLDVPLSAIRAMPEWSINGTTAENGKRFRFKNGEIGDWTLGYAQAPDFRLADAVAVSAAFPGGFGPLVLDTKDYVWKKRTWNAAKGTEDEVEVPFRHLHLYDGGVYDNLGAEPFFDSGSQEPKNPGDYVVISDAGAPLRPGLNMGPLNPFRLRRVAVIMSDQSRALRIRSFMNYLTGTAGLGALIMIGTSGSDSTRADADFARTFPTSLCKLNPTSFDRLAGHGYAAAAHTWTARSLTDQMVIVG